MASTDIKVDGAKLFSDVTMRVTLSRSLSVRLWIAAALIKCAAFVLRCEVVIDREGVAK